MMYSLERAVLHILWNNVRKQNHTLNLAQERFNLSNAQYAKSLLRTDPAFPIQNIRYCGYILWLDS